MFTIQIPAPPVITEFYESDKEMVSINGYEYINSIKDLIYGGDNFIDLLFLGTNTWGLKIHILVDYEIMKIYSLDQLSRVLIKSLTEIKVIPPNIEIHVLNSKIGNVEDNKIKISISESEIVPPYIIQKSDV